MFVSFWIFFVTVGGTNITHLTHFFYSWFFYLIIYWIRVFSQLLNNLISTNVSRFPYLFSLLTVFDQLELLRIFSNVSRFPDVFSSDRFRSARIASYLLQCKSFSRSMLSSSWILSFLAICSSSSITFIRSFSDFIYSLMYFLWCKYSYSLFTAS